MQIFKLLGLHIQYKYGNIKYGLKMQIVYVPKFKRLEYGINGVALWRLGMEDPTIWDMLANETVVKIVENYRL